MPHIKSPPFKITHLHQTADNVCEVSLSVSVKQIQETIRKVIYVIIQRSSIDFKLCPLKFFNVDLMS